jgi:protein-tyrosine-phosphatase
MTPAIVRGVELIIVMDKAQARYIERVFRVDPNRIVIAGDLDPLTSPSRGVKDPWMQPVHVFEASFDRLDRCAGTLIRALNHRT